MTLKWTIRIAMLFLVLAATSAGAANKCSITGFGGLSMPTGDFSDENKFDAQSGYNFGGEFDYMINEKFAVGVDGSYNKNKHGGEGDVLSDGQGNTAVYSKDEFTTSQFGAHGKYFFPSTSQMGFFGLVGLGMYDTTEKWEGTISPAVGPAFTDNDQSSTDNRFGYRFGLGGMYSLNPQWGLGLEADYNFITQDKDKVGVSSLQYMSLRTRVGFSIGK